MDVLCTQVLTCRSLSIRWNRTQITVETNPFWINVPIAPTLYYMLADLS